MVGICWNTTFLLERPFFRGELLVSARVSPVTRHRNLLAICLTFTFFLFFLLFLFIRPCVQLGMTRDPVFVYMILRVAIDTPSPIKMCCFSWNNHVKWKVEATLRSCWICVSSRITNAYLSGQVTRTKLYAYHQPSPLINRVNLGAGNTKWNLWSASPKTSLHDKHLLLYIFQSKMNAHRWLFKLNEANYKHL